MQTCNGHGECLIQEGLNTYSKNENISCDHNCISIKCPNYILCETEAPQWLFDCCHGVCRNCDMMFGKWQGGKGELEVVDNVECPICLDEKTCITQPKCQHYLCVDCFRRCYYGDDDSENEPQFPYSREIEEEYDNDESQWEDDELIKKFNEDWNAWQDAKELKREQEQNLQCCPLCRK